MIYPYHILQFSFSHNNIDVLTFRCSFESFTLINCFQFQIGKFSLYMHHKLSEQWLKSQLRTVFEKNRVVLEQTMAILFSQEEPSQRKQRNFNKSSTSENGHKLLKAFSKSLFIYLPHLSIHLHIHPLLAALLI